MAFIKIIPWGLNIHNRTCPYCFGRASSSSVAPAGFQPAPGRPPIDIVYTGHQQGVLWRSRSEVQWFGSGRIRPTENSVYEAVMPGTSSPGGGGGGGGATRGVVVLGSWFNCGRSETVY